MCDDKISKLFIYKRLSYSQRTYIIYCITNTKIIYVNLYILYIYLNFHMKIYVVRNKIIIIFISRDFKAAFANNIQKMEILGK